MASISSTPHGLQAFEQEVRTLLHGLRRMDPVATRQYFLFDPLAGHVEPGLVDVRYAVARRHGFRSWHELALFVLSAKEPYGTPPWFCPD
jgi:hypothetical protein